MVTELSDGTPLWQDGARTMSIPVVSEYDDGEEAWIVAGVMSSTLGELVALDHTLEVTERHAPPEAYRGKRISCQVDGQAAVGALLRMYSAKPEIMTKVFEIWARVIRMGADLEVIWVPREENQVADLNSKREDPGAWAPMAQWDASRVREWARGVLSAEPEGVLDRFIESLLRGAKPGKTPGQCLVLCNPAK